MSIGNIYIGRLESGYFSPQHFTLHTFPPELRLRLFKRKKLANNINLAWLGSNYWMALHY